MKVVIKYKSEDGWTNIDAMQLADSTVLDYIKNSDKEVVAAAYENDVPCLFISNSQEQVDKYKSKGVSIHVLDALYIFGTIQPEAITMMAKIMGGTIDLIETKRKKENEIQDKLF